MATLPRGLRNNNPLNLRKTNTEWKGKIIPGTDPDFEQFIDMLWGIRAAFINVRTLMRRTPGCNIKQLIYMWAPPADGNNTGEYVRQVETLSHYSQFTVLDFKNKELMVEVLWAMAAVECGQRILHVHFENAYEML